MIETANIIALLTDFGTRDHYVGVMKGVILGVNRHAHLIDISHDIPPQGLLDAYFLLSNTCPHFPDGTIFVTVVDPSVGSDRAILAVESKRHLFLAPDNGILGFLENEGSVRRIVQVRNPKYFLKPVSNTFHGRDIFAPVAGHLSLGLDLRKLGPEVKGMEKITAPVPRITREGVIVGEIVSIDHFGNLITNIPGDRLVSADQVEVRVGKTTIPQLARSYASAKKGRLLAVIGSSGSLEISVSQVNAQRKTGAKTGDIIRVRHSQS